MFQLIKNLNRTQLLLQQIPQLVLSAAVVEQFCKFGSFTLECLAFLGIWGITDALVSTIFPSNKRTHL